MTHSSIKLSVGLILRSNTIWRWQSELIQALSDAEIICVVEVAFQGDPKSMLPNEVARLYKLDSLIFRSPMKAFELVEFTAPEKSIVHQGVELSSNATSRDLDLWINLSEGLISDEFGSKSQFGVFETHFSEQSAPDSLISTKVGYSEFSKGEKQLYFSIIADSPKWDPLLIAESRPSLDSDSLSRSMNQYWKLLNASWLRTIKGLQTKNLKQLSRVKTETKKNVNGTSTGPLKSRPYKYLGSLFVNKLSQKFLRKEQWVLLLQFIDQSEKFNEIPLSFADYTEISPPEDCFWADPFVITENNRHYVFFEELPFATERGHLSCMEVFSDGSYAEPKVILKEPFHLSYPNVFAYESDYYMVPESGDNGLISLYKSTDFPYQWVHEYNLMEELHAYDSTLVEHDGIWWLFACVAAEKGMSGNEELHVFYADTPLSQSWESHPQNPVISDASRARPAGKLFYSEGALLRPSQDCAGSYGAGVNINKIVVLNKQNYEEELVQCSRPNWDSKLTALHTLNFNQHVSVADAMRVESRFI